MKHQHNEPMAKQEATINHALKQLGATNWRNQK